MSSQIKIGIAYTVKGDQPPVWIFHGDRVEVKTVDGGKLIDMTDTEFRDLLTAYVKSNPTPTP